MLKHKVMHQEAEKIIQKSQVYCQEKERQRQLLLSQGLMQPPPETSLLGCWQIIERTFTYNETSGRVPNFQLGDEKLFILSIDSEKKFSGEFISSGRTVLEGEAKGHRIKQLRGQITGKILGDGHLRYRFEPNNDCRVFFVNGAMMRTLPGLSEANYTAERMWGSTNSSSFLDNVKQEYEAVPIPNQILI